MTELEAVIFDWAGTVVDFGSLAPTSIFVQAFKEAFDFDLTLEEARVPMGLGKWDHIRALGNLPEVNRRWKAQFGESMSDAQVDELYRAFMPLQKAKVVDFAEPLPGALATIEFLKNQGIKIGSCSGYPREVMDVLVNKASEFGYSPDCVVATDDLPQGGRPNAAMALQNALALQVKSVFNCVKVDDAVPGILEGLNAGMWTVGIVDTGNEMGLTQAEFEALSNEQLAHRRLQVQSKLTASGAHYTVNSIAELPEVLNDIEQRLRLGERP